MTEAASGRPRDIRLEGFPDRTPLARAWAWLDALPAPETEEICPPDRAAGRVLAAPVHALTALPPTDRAATDGYAVRAAETEGAGPYNPLPLPARPLAAGEALPPGADAVLPFESAAPLAGRLDALAPAAAGEGVERRGAQLAEGAEALPAGTRLGPAALGLLALLGVPSVRLRARPSVALLVRGPKPPQRDALTPMLCALLARDGAAVTEIPDIAAIPPADLILIAGRSAAGPDDDAVPALAGAGARIEAHGIALRPGGSAALARLGATPAILLPGEPLACLAAYDLLAARLLRRFAGLPGALPYPGRLLPLGRKIVSAIGFTDLVRVALRDGAALPLGAPEAGGLPAACRADGFVLVPERLEGYAAGETVRVRLYGEGQTEETDA